MGRCMQTHQTPWSCCTNNSKLKCVKDQKLGCSRSVCKPRTPVWCEDNNKLSILVQLIIVGMGRVCRLTHLGGPVAQSNKHSNDFRHIIKLCRFGAVCYYKRHMHIYPRTCCRAKPDSAQLKVVRFPSINCEPCKSQPDQSCEVCLKKEEERLATTVLRSSGSNSNIVFHYCYTCRHNGPHVKLL